MKNLTDSEKLQARITALREARSLHPDQLNNQWGGTLQTGRVTPTLDTVLATADKVYDWLIK